MVETLTLYRPVGLKETELVLASDCAGFPPRLPDQPIFYPVMSAAYARQIARDWNAPDAGSGYVGFVTTFDVDAAFAARYPVRTVGARGHQELWVPSEELTDFNARLVGPVRFTEVWYGTSYQGPDSPLGPLASQLKVLLAADSARLRELIRTCPAVFLCNHGWWESTPARTQGLEDGVLDDLLTRVRAAWAEARPAWPLPARVV
ncbi:hypothetical protein JY651_47010 [Pyxidicoccus parkwayensis]|uniref:Uncharacterized protein n=1 Tax=Pyxidicoccus parkwayensis TaxID=2813578 RepID=A0ABX7NYM6_9BACT|nr:hypothetical protein [Pyxidicoccus parkwaysis]QSQ22582.1 hypothetical protein JY651_47010 [Pyxidicoccus parkwaysis]